MTKNERINQLEIEVAKLKVELAMMRTQRVMTPIVHPSPPNWWNPAPWNPWQITCTTESSDTNVQVYS